MSNVEHMSDIMHLSSDKPFLGLLVGKSASGKTAIALDFIAKSMIRPSGPAWAKVVVLSTTADLQAHYWGGFDRRDVHTNADDYFGILEQLIDFQRKAHLSGKALPVLVVFDDVIGVFRGKKAGEFEKIFTLLVTQGRHFGISVLCLIQYLKDRIFAAPMVRSQIDFCVCGVIGDTSEEQFVQLAVKGKKETAAVEKIASKCWEERYRFCCLARDTRYIGKTSRLTSVKINPENSPKLKICYRE